MRQSIVNNIAEIILKISLPHPVRVGINGVDGSGKTHFAKELFNALKSKTDRQIILASIDGFHNPRSVRYLKGRRSAEGFYTDSFQYQKVQDLLLEPLGPQGSRKYQSRIFNVRTDQVIEEQVCIAEDDSILVIEGIFLFRPELVSELDLKIYLDVSFEVTLHRMLTRDQELFESRAEEIQLFNERYRPGQELYIRQMNPRNVADLVIDNTSFEYSRIIKK